MSDTNKNFPLKLIIGLAAVGLAVILTVLAVVLSPKSAPKAPETSIPSTMQKSPSQPKTSLTVSQGRQISPPNANKEEGIFAYSNALTGAPHVVIYQDYQCPACAQAEKLFGIHVTALAKRGEIKLEYRTMAFLDQRLRNDSSTKAAIAAACADVGGVYPAYNSAIFAAQPSQESTGFTEGQFTDFATKVGLNGDKLSAFQECRRDALTADFVKSVDSHARTSGVRGTPTYLVNSVALDLSTVEPTEAGVKAAIDRIAKR